MQVRMEYVMKGSNNGRNNGRMEWKEGSKEARIYTENKYPAAQGSATHDTSDELDLRATSLGELIL